MTDLLKLDYNEHNQKIQPYKNHYIQMLSDGGLRIMNFGINDIKVNDIKVKNMIIPQWNNNMPSINPYIIYRDTFYYSHEKIEQNAIKYPLHLRSRM